MVQVGMTSRTTKETEMMPNTKNTDKPPFKVTRVQGEEDLFTSTWTGFLNGHWTKKAPIRPGRYYIADRQGHPAGVLVFYRHPSTGKVVPTTSWEGWFWSFPLPPTPTPPPREWGDDHPHLTVVK